MVRELRSLEYFQHLRGSLSEILDKLQEPDHPDQSTDKTPIACLFPRPIYTGREAGWITSKRKRRERQLADEYPEWAKNNPEEADAYEEARAKEKMGILYDPELTIVRVGVHFGAECSVCGFISIPNRGDRMFNSWECLGKILCWGCFGDYRHFCRRKRLDSSTSELNFVGWLIEVLGTKRGRDNLLPSR